VWTVELQSDYRGPRGRIVTDCHYAKVATITAAIGLTRDRWRITGRRPGSQMHVRYTADHGQVITHTYRYG
jgi:hypothetical protein